MAAFMNPLILFLAAIPAPEPATLALMGLALISLTFIRLPKNKK